MKKYLFVWAIALVALVSCNNQPKDAAIEAKNSFDALIEQARWGSGEAYVKLADCYRDGKGVERDLCGMFFMLYLAQDYGGIRSFDDYMKNIPEDSDFRLVYEIMEHNDKWHSETGDSLANVLVERGVPDGYVIRAANLLEKGDTLEGKRLIDLAASKGSVLAEIILCKPELLQRSGRPDIARLAKLTDKHPYIYLLLAQESYERRHDDGMDEQKVIGYLQMADLYACLTKKDAQRLLRFQEEGKCQLPNADIDRLKKLAGKE